MHNQEQQISDLIRVVYLHEQLRATYGPGLVPDPRYEATHQIMSKLSRHLGAAPSNMELEQMLKDYQDLPEHFGFNNTIAVSC